MIIKNTFVPEKVGSYYIFGQRIVAFEITKTNVYVAIVYRKARAITIEKFIDIALVQGSPEDYSERVSNALKLLVPQIPRSAKIYTTIPSSQCLFKELKLPFIGRDKIAMVVNYEVEPLLPFSLSDAIIDFVVTRELTAEKSSEVLVIAVQKHYIAQHIALFEQAGISPYRISIDFLGLYSFFKQTPSYANKKGGLVFLELENMQTRLAYISDGALRSARTLPKGLYDLARAISEKIRIEPAAIMDHLLRVGLQQDENPEHQKIYQEVLASFVNDISLTLQSFARQANMSNAISHIILFGPCTAIKGLPELITDTLSVTCAKWDVQEFIRTQQILVKTKQATIPQTQLITTGTAIPDPNTEPFNLRKDEFAPNSQKDFLTTLIVSTALSLTIIITLAISSYIKVSHLRHEANESEAETVDILKERFTKIPEDVSTLDDVIEEAQKTLNREEKIWSAFSGSGRESILRYLLELSNIIDKQSLGLKLERLTIGEDTITLRARIRGFEELKALVRDLRQSKLFSYVELPQNLPQNEYFTMLIRLAKPGAG